MEKVIRWDGPLYGLTTYKEFICIYERIFDKVEDNWSDEYYLTPVDEDAVNFLLKDWTVWCKTVQDGDFFDYSSSYKENIYCNVIEASAQKRAYRKKATFFGCFDRGYIPIDYTVEWT